MDALILSDEERDQLDETLEHFNANHADTILLIARFAAGCPEATDAEALAVDGEGIDFSVRTADGDGRARMSFPQPAVTFADVQGYFYATLAEARGAAGDDVELTSLEREFQTTASLPTFVTSLAAIRHLTPNLVELEFTGGLDDFQSIGGDQFLYLMVPRTDGDPVPPDHTMADQMAADPATAPAGAYYTVRHWDAAAGRLTMWAVLHGDGDGVGGWAGRCEVGERVAMWGPREGMGARPDAANHLLVADETGVAAVAALLDELPADVTGHAVLETVDPDHVVDLPDRPGIRITWLFRHDDEPGAANRLLAAVRDLELDTDGLVAFGAAESRQITAVRKYLRHDRDMAASDVSMTGYWRRFQVVSDTT